MAPENSLAQVERAVEIIRGILDEHEGMKPEFPPRVYLTGFNDDSFNVLMMYWYHPADLWAFHAFNHDVNVRITRAFEQEGIEFAWPSITNFLEHHEGKTLQVNSGDERA